MAETEKSQLERFKEVAKDVEADTSDDAIDKIMGKLDLTKVTARFEPPCKFRRLRSRV